jgi:hypothetical protein
MAYSILDDVDYLVEETQWMILVTGEKLNSRE